MGFRKALLFAVSLAMAGTSLPGCLHSQPRGVTGGVAFYERRAAVEDGTVTVRVPRERVDDFLKSLTVVDPETRKPLAVTIPRQQAEDGSYLTMTLETGDASRKEVLLTYVTEAPAWKPSYRVVLGAEGKVMLEGWAIVDNTSAEDWKGVLIGVGASSALAFRYDLWSVRQIDRDLLAGEDRFAIAPPTGVSPYSDQNAVELAQLDATQVRPASGEAAKSGPSSRITGVVTDAKTKQPAVGVTVVATGPALAGESVALTDERGAYAIDVPAGEYKLSFYSGTTTIERGGVVAVAGKTAAADQAFTEQPGGGGEVISISESTKNVPVPGRTFDATLGAAAGSQTDGVGVTYSGSSTLESQYYVDGVSTTGMTYGTTSGSSEEPPPPPPPVRLGDEKLQTIATRVRERREDVLVEVSGRSEDAQEAAARGAAVKNALVDKGVAAARIRVVTKLVPNGASNIRVLAVAAGTARAETRELGPDVPVGESHFFADRAMTVASGTSAMVSMLRKETSGGVAYLYDPVSDRGDQRYAFKAVRLDNPTGDTLEPGPITVYGDSRFIGEGITEAVPPHASVVVPFALDKQVVVTREGDEDDRIAKLLVVQRGVITAEVQHRRQTTFTLTSRLAEPAVVYLRHRLESGWTLVDAPPDSMSVGDSRLFAVDLAAGETRTVTIAEATPIERTFGLNTEEALGMMRVYIDEPTAAPELVAAVKALLATHKEVADLEDKIVTLRQQLGEYRSRSAELNTQLVSLKAVKTGGPLMSTLRTKLAEMSTRTQKATIALVDAQESQMLARVELQNQLADLRLPDATAATAAAAR